MLASISVLASPDFWIGVGLLAGTYCIMNLGLQLNVGEAGLINFGQAGFLALGGYAMGLLVTRGHWALVPSVVVALVIAGLGGLAIGMLTLRLRADYFAIVSLAFAQIVLSIAQNARSLTGGNQGLYGFDAGWVSTSDTIDNAMRSIGVTPRPFMSLLLVVWLSALLCAAGLTVLKRSAWGRALRSIREDQDAARALGKNVLRFKLQALCLGAALGALAGCFLALQLSLLTPEEFDPSFTFLGLAALILGGLGSYRGVVIGSILLWTLLEVTRFAHLPLSDARVAALRYMLVGAALVGLMMWRPQGLFGKREEMVLGD